MRWLEQRRQQSAFQDLSKEAQDLIAKVRAHFARADLDILREAALFAEGAHAGQTRASGDPYIRHSYAVADILADLRLDPVTIAAALLHDVAEDTGITLEQVAERFGPEIAALVDGVTKLGKIEWQSREERQAESLRKMFLAMANDIRIVLIKLADRLHNMRTLQYLPEWKRKRTAQETLDIYAPLAERLGIGQLQSELQDLAFGELNPDGYQEIATQLQQAEATSQAFLDRVITILHRELNRAGIKVERYNITARPKQIHSIWQKMQRPKYAGASVARIYDRLGVRIIVDDVKECYAALGVVHSLWRPIPGEFDDYIANPKTTGYQSLHTAVIYEGEPLEIQIRTAQMHHEAEYGIAAHWKYRQRPDRPPAAREAKPEEREFERKLSWVRQLLEWHQEVQDARAFVQSVKLDLFQNEVFVFTPKGDVIDLPAGATPIDFAYRIHTEVGHHAVGAKVNGRLVPLSHGLHTGDIVEITTAKTGGGPSRDWLTFVVTSNAKAKIKQWFKRERREENIQRGRELLERELRRTGGVAAYVKGERLREVARTSGLPSEEELLAALGNGDLSLLQVVQALRGEEAQPETPPPRRRRPAWPRGGACASAAWITRCCASPAAARRCRATASSATSPAAAASPSTAATARTWCFCASTRSDSWRWSGRPSRTGTIPSRWKWKRSIGSGSSKTFWRRSASPGPTSYP
jgi:GTP pyrophosphokinase